MQYSCDSILIRALLTKFRSAYWSWIIFGGFRDVTYFMGGSAMCDKVWQGGGGSKLVKNSVTYFMDGPLILFPSTGNLRLSYCFGPAYFLICCTILSAPDLRSLWTFLWTDLKKVCSSFLLPSKQLSRIMHSYRCSLQDVHKSACFPTPSSLSSCGLHPPFVVVLI